MGTTGVKGSLANSKYPSGGEATSAGSRATIIVALPEELASLIEVLETVLVNGPSVIISEDSRTLALSNTTTTWANPMSLVWGSKIKEKVWSGGIVWLSGRK
jgi:hypothetical protein